MDTISLINSAFSQFQRTEQMSFSGGNNRSEVGHREQVTRSNPLQLLQDGAVNRRSASSPDSVHSSVQNALSYERSESGTLQLRTQEGDLVQIKFLNAESSNAQNQQFANGGTVVSEFSLEGSSSTSFQMVVDGDLSGAEVDAVRNVLLQAREMASTFYDGNTRAAFDMASSFKIDGEQLANVNMNLVVQESYTYANTPVEPQNPQVPDVPPPADLTQPVPPAVDSAPPVSPVAQPPSVTSQVTQPDLTVTAPSAPSEQSNGLTSQAPQPEEAAVHVAPSPTAGNPVEALSNALTTITDFLHNITNSLEAFNKHLQNPDTPMPFSLSNGFQLQVFSDLITQLGMVEGEGSTTEPGVNEPNGKGHALAASTISEFAMIMDAHVDSKV